MRSLLSKQTALVGAVVITVVMSLTACKPMSPDATGRFWFRDVPNGPAIASCIMNRESGTNPRAISATGDYGLFQINRAAHKRTFESKIGGPFEQKALDSWNNARYARYLYDQVGWSPWRGGRWKCF